MATFLTIPSSAISVQRTSNGGTIVRVPGREEGEGQVSAFSPGDTGGALGVIAAHLEGKEEWRLHLALAIGHLRKEDGSWEKGLLEIIERELDEEPPF